MAPGKMSLLGGLIYEGMDATLKAFQQMSKDEQVKVVNENAEKLKAKLSQIQAQTEQIKSNHIRNNLQLALSEFFDELEDVVRSAPHDPLGAFVHLLFIPVEIIFRLSELVWAALYGWLENLFFPSGPVSYKEAQVNALEFFTVSGDINVLAAIFDIIGDIEILGTKLPGRAIGKLITNISWTFGLGWLSWAVLSPVIEASITDPIRTEINKITRSRNWTPTEIRELYEYGIDKLEEHVEELAELGYSNDKIEKLIDMMKRIVLREEARSWVTYMISAYVKGYITDDELMRAITMAYWTNEEQNFKYWQGKVRKEAEIIDLRVKEIETAFKKKRIDENEARARLTQYITDPNMVEAYIALWKQYIKPEQEVEALETANLKLQKLKIRIERLQKQIEHLQVVEQQQIAIYDAEIEELKARLEAMIAAAKEEYAAFADKTATDLQNRIVYWQALLPTASEKEAVKIQAKIQLLQELAQTKLNERAAKANALIERWTKEINAKIKTIEAKKAKYEEDMKRRIDDLKYKLEEYKLEYTATEKVVKELEGAA